MIYLCEETRESESEKSGISWNQEDTGTQLWARLGLVFINQLILVLRFCVETGAGGPRTFSASPVRGIGRLRSVDGKSTAFPSSCPIVFFDGAMEYESNLRKSANISSTKNKKLIVYPNPPNFKTNQSNLSLHNVSYIYFSFFAIYKNTFSNYQLTFKSNTHFVPTWRHAAIWCSFGF